MSCGCDDCAGAELGADDDPEPPRPPVVDECMSEDWKPSPGMSRKRCIEMAARVHCGTRPWDAWCKWYGRKVKRERAERTKAALALVAFAWLMWRD